MTNETTLWYQTDSSGRAELAARYQGVPLSALDLPPRPYNALIRSDPNMDVAQLLTADETIARITGLGGMSLVQINERMLVLLAGTPTLAPPQLSAPGTAGTSNTGIEVRSVAVTDASDTPLPVHVASRSIGVLHLSVRTSKALVENGIVTIGQLDCAGTSELCAIPGISKATVADAKGRVAALRNSVREDGTIDWQVFCQVQDIKLLPSTAHKVDSTRTLVRLLPKLVVQAMALEDNPRLQEVAEQRFDYGDARRSTLEDLARGFKIGRERVRQLEVMVLSYMHEALVCHNFTARPYHIEPLVIEAFAPLWSHIRAAAVSAVTEVEFDRSLTANFDLSDRDLQRVKHLLLGLAGIERIRLPGDSLSPLLYVEPFPFAFDPVTVIPAIHDALLRRTEPARFSAIRTEIGRQIEIPLQTEDLRAAIRLCSSVEELPDNYYRCRFEALSTRADQVERILVEHDRPMKVTEIWRTMNQRLVQQHKRPNAKVNISNLLVAEARFEPIGHSGQWVLKRWDVETSDIATLMQEYFLRQNRPCSPAEITAYVLQLRPGRESSIPSILSFKPDFVRLDDGLWGLREWGEPSTQTNWNREKVTGLVEEYFKSQRVERIELSTLRGVLAQAAGISEKASESRLTKCPAVRIEGKGRQRMAVFQPDYASQPKASRSQTSKTLFQKLSEDCLVILNRVPGKQLPILDLVKQMRELSPEYATTPLPTFRNYIAKLKFVERYQEPNGRRLIVRLKNADLHRTRSEGRSHRHNEGKGRSHPIANLA